MTQRVKLELAVEDVDYIINVLGSVPTLQTVQANKLGLIPLIRDQAQYSLQMQQKEAAEEEMRDKMRILREARLASERERGGFVTALGGENVVLETLTKEPEPDPQNTLPFGSANEYQQRQDAARANIEAQHDLRRRLDAIEKAR